MNPIMTLTAVGTTLAGLGFLGQFTSLFYIPIILLKLVGFASFRVRNDRDRIKGLLKLLDKETRSSSSIFEYGKLRPGGVFMNWRCFGYYMDSGKDSDMGTEIVVFTSESNFQRMMEKSVSPCVSLTLEHSTTSKSLHTNSYPVTVWNRQGGYTSIYYRSLTIDMSNIYPLGDQVHIVSDIVHRYSANKRLTAFVHGITGAGKSTIGILVAKELQGSYCHEFNPTDPGDSFLTILRDVEHSTTEDSGPLVIVMEEINTMIRAVDAGNVRHHKNVTTSVQSKGTFNSFLDDMVFHKNVILIMTSNESKESIDAIDPSYLRPGRVNAYYSMMNSLEPT